VSFQTLHSPLGSLGIDASLVAKLASLKCPMRRASTRPRTRTSTSGPRIRRNTIHLSNVTPWTPPESLILNPPKDWSETNVAGWLNDIGAALEDIYANINRASGAYTTAGGKRMLPPKKIWCPRHSGNILEGSSIKRKPDVILLDTSSIPNPAWPQVHALCEITRSDLKKNRTIKDTILQKSLIAITLQSNRNFYPCLSFSHDSFTFTICNRSGVVESNTLKVKKHPLLLLRIIAGLMFTRPSDIGYDKTIECDKNGKAINIWLKGKKFRVIKELFMSDSMRGHATRCWCVVREEDINQEEYVLKDSWADVRRTHSEIWTLKLIEEKGLCEGKVIPRLVLGEDVCVYTGTDSKPIYIRDTTARRRDPTVKHVDERVHRWLLMGPVGKHISTFTSLKELIGAFVDLVEGWLHPSVIACKFNLI
jgi:Fungal protein kinase